MNNIFKVPIIKEIPEIYFTSPTLDSSIDWAIDYWQKKIILEEIVGNNGCYENLSRNVKAGLIAYNTIYRELNRVDEYHNEKDIKALINPENLIELTMCFPLILELIKLDAIIVTSPICIYQGTQINMFQHKIRSNIQNNKINISDDDIGYLKHQISEKGRKLFIYYPAITPTMVSPITFEPFIGLMLRYSAVTVNSEFYQIINI